MAERHEGDNTEKKEVIEKSKTIKKERIKQRESKEVKNGARAKTSEKKKREDVHIRLKKAEAEVEILKDRLLRTLAELENFKKRTQREFSKIVQDANGRLIKDILPAIDDLERSLKTTQKRGGEKAFRKGVELIYHKMMSVLRSYGLEPMESVNKAFDVERHDALLQIEKKGTLPGMVVEEHEKGYLLNGKVLRHAKVLVSK